MLVRGSTEPLDIPQLQSVTIYQGFSGEHDPTVRCVPLRCPCPTRPGSLTLSTHQVVLAGLFRDDGRATAAAPVLYYGNGPNPGNRLGCTPAQVRLLAGSWTFGSRAPRSQAYVHGRRHGTIPPESHLLQRAVAVPISRSADNGASARARDGGEVRSRPRLDRRVFG